MMKSSILLSSLLSVFGLQAGEHKEQSSCCKPSIATLTKAKGCCSALADRAFVVSAVVPPLVVCDLLCPETPCFAMGIGAAIGVGSIACNKTADWLDRKIQVRIQQEGIAKQEKMQ